MQHGVDVIQCKRQLEGSKVRICARDQRYYAQQYTYMSQL